MASRPTKYAAVTTNLPRLPGVEPERKDIVDLVKEEILSSPIDIQDFNLASQAHHSLHLSDNAVLNAIALLKRLCGGKTHASAFAAGYAEVRTAIDTLANQKSSMQVLLDAYEQLMLAQMEAEGVASLRLETGASVSTYSEPYGQVKDKEAFRRWCIVNGYENQLQLWPSTQNAITKERCLAGEAPPDGVEVFAKTMVRLNKA